MNPPSKPLRERLKELELHDTVNGKVNILPETALLLGSLLDDYDIDAVLALLTQELERVVKDGQKDNISLCNFCNCMTHTIEGHCGKCQAVKTDTPTSPEAEAIFNDVTRAKVGSRWFVPIEEIQPKIQKLLNQPLGRIRAEVLEAEIRGLSYSRQATTRDIDVINRINELGYELATLREQPQETE